MKKVERTGKVNESEPAELPGWFRMWRVLTVLVAAGYVLSGILFPMEKSPAVWEVAMAVVTLFFWFLPWIWLRRGWIWWPFYLFSVSISFYILRSVVGVWMVQLTQPAAVPFLHWSYSMQYQTLYSTLMGGWALWQSAMLGLARVRGFRGTRRKVDPRRAYFRGHV